MRLQQATRNADSSLTVFLTADRCRLRTANSSCLSSSLPLDSISPCWSLLLSVVDCPSASPFANCLLWVPFFNWLLWRSLAHCPGFSRTCLSYPTSGRVEDLELGPKRSSAWRTRLIVLHCQIFCFCVWLCRIFDMHVDSSMSIQLCIIINSSENRNVYIAFFPHFLEYT